MKILSGILWVVAICIVCWVMLVIFAVSSPAQSHGAASWSPQPNLIRGSVEWRCDLVAAHCAARLSDAGRARQVADQAILASGPDFAPDPWGDRDIRGLSPKKR